MNDKHRWPYVAGIVDGEGSFSIYFNEHSQTHNARITIGNTSISLIKYLLHNFGGTFYSFQPEKMHGFNRRVMYSWRLSGSKNKENFILGILPHLVIKKEQAKTFLEFLRVPRCGRWSLKEQVSQNRETRDFLMKKLSSLNHGDISVSTNTQDSTTVEMIEPELMGDHESAPDVNQGLDYCPKCKEYLHDEMGHMCPSNLA